MRLKPTYFLCGVVVLALLLSPLGRALANHFGVSQFWTIFKLEEGGREVKVFNPTGTEMFVLLIEYNLDREFQSCTGAVVSGAGRTGDNDNGDGFDKVENRSYNEVIAVPISGKFAGKITNHSVGVRVWRGTTVVPWTPADAAGFVLRSGVESCACDELASFGLPATLLMAFGIFC